MNLHHARELGITVLFIPACHDRIGIDDWHDPRDRAMTLIITKVPYLLLTPNRLTANMASWPVSHPSILTKLSVAWLQCLYENWHFQGDRPLRAPFSLHLYCTLKAVHTPLISTNYICTYVYYGPDFPVLFTLDRTSLCSLLQHLWGRGDGTIHKVNSRARIWDLDDWPWTHLTDLWPHSVLIRRPRSSSRTYESSANSWSRHGACSWKQNI